MNNGGYDLGGNSCVGGGRRILIRGCNDFGFWCGLGSGKQALQLQCTCGLIDEEKRQGDWQLAVVGRNLELGSVRPCVCEVMGYSTYLGKCSVHNPYGVHTYTPLYMYTVPRICKIKQGGGAVCGGTD